MEEKNIINATTMIPLSAFVAISAGIFWLSVMYENVQNMNEEIKQIKIQLVGLNRERQADREKVWRIEKTIDSRLSKIEGKLDILISNKKRL